MRTVTVHGGPDRHFQRAVSSGPVSAVPRSRTATKNPSRSDRDLRLLEPLSGRRLLPSRFSSGASPSIAQIHRGGYQRLSHLSFGPQVVDGDDLLGEYG